MKDNEQLTALQKLRSLAAADPENFIFKAFAVSIIEEKMLDLQDFLINRDTIEEIDEDDELRRNFISSNCELADFKYFLSQLSFSSGRKSVFEIVVENEIFGRNPRKQFQDLVQFLFDFEYMSFYCFPRFVPQFFFVAKVSRKVRYFIDTIRAAADDDEVRALQKIISAAAQKLTLEEFFEIRRLLKTA